MCEGVWLVWPGCEVVAVVPNLQTNESPSVGQGLLLHLWKGGERRRALVQRGSWNSVSLLPAERPPRRALSSSLRVAGLARQRPFCTSCTLTARDIAASWPVTVASAPVKPPAWRRETCLLWAASLARATGARN